MKWAILKSPGPYLRGSAPSLGPWPMHQGARARARRRSCQWQYGSLTGSQRFELVLCSWQLKNDCSPFRRLPKQNVIGAFTALCYRLFSMVHRKNTHKVYCACIYMHDIVMSPMSPIVNILAVEVLLVKLKTLLN